MVICENTDCKKHASFNNPSEPNARFCATHKLENMINVKHARCEHTGCNKQPSYNLPGLKARFCATHKLENMIAVFTRCEHEECNTQPTYNLPNEPKARFCDIHKLADMINVKNARCEHTGCNTRPNYNLPGESKARFCAIHKLEGMISTSNKFCLECKSPATYGITGKKPTHCETHKKPDQVCIAELSKCVNCPKSWAALHNNKKYCLDCCPCKKTVIHVGKICVTCNPEYYEFDKTSVCKGCIQNKHASHIREWIVMKHLTKTIDTPFIHDKAVGECTKKRPDAMFELLRHVVIVEVDENQHQNYQCERARINEIISSIGGKPVIIIRFNPDGFSHNNVKQTFKLVDRLPLLTEVVKRELIAIPEKFMVKVIQLYYDCNVPTLSYEQTTDITSTVAF